MSSAAPRRCETDYRVRKTRDIVSSLEGQCIKVGIACAFMRGDMEQKKRFKL